MNRKLILILLSSLSALVLILILIKVFSGSPEQTQNEEENPNDKAQSYFSSSGDGFEVDPYYLESSKNLFQPDGRFLRFDEIMDRVRSGEINLVSELWTLRRQCPEGSTREQCNEYIKAFLKNQYSEEEAKHLMTLLNGYLRYEEAMVQFETPKDISNQEKYELVKNFRRKFFSNDDANLVFGLEETTAEFSFNRKQFLDETKNVSGDERIRQYDQFRKKTFGNYYESVQAREPKFGKFETEMELRNIELSKLDSSQRDTKEKEIRIRYFGKDGNERMEKVLKDMKEEEEREKKLAKEEEEYLRKNPNLPEKEKEKKLLEMRTQILGSKELAEEYTRRQEYEKNMKELTE
ncbi:lipase secretion chaperone [Leptospira idonii]|uniref:Lipase helper protein n=1 Tax=Leptospira idonii TaxID=1193500 RepID=A0A4R9M4X7_9LEPT|nr:lipase secretion chaperone [Leptospira idonii]TGN20767.1 lipase [Leptospira idonii]